MKLFRFPLLLGAALALPNFGAHAQTAAPTTTIAPAPDQLTTAQIPLQNVPAGLMAYWLDPAHNSVPIMIRYSNANGSKIPQFEANTSATASAEKSLKLRPGNGNGPLNLKLPAGITTIVPVDPKEELIARGTPQALEQLRAIVAQLDVPLQQVEIEAQFVAFTPADLESLHLDFRQPKGGSSVPILGDIPLLGGRQRTTKVNSSQLSQAAVAETGPNLLGQLNQLIAAGHTKVVTAPRVTPINGLTAQLTSTESRTVALGQPETPNLDGERDAFQPGMATIYIETGIRVTPVLHGNLVAIDMQTALDSQITQISAVLQDKKTFALRLPQRSPDQITVVFITARILKRAGE